MNNYSDIELIIKLKHPDPRVNFQAYCDSMPIDFYNEHSYCFDNVRFYSSMIRMNFKENYNPWHTSRLNEWLHEIHVALISYYMNLG